MTSGHSLVDDTDDAAFGGSSILYWSLPSRRYSTNAGPQLLSLVRSCFVAGDQP
jgi:hypothetical protein